MKRGRWTEPSGRRDRAWLPIAHGTLVVLVVAATLGHVARAEEPYNPLKPADTSDPRATLNSFIDSCNELYEALRAARDTHRHDQRIVPLVARALDCLDMSEIPEYAREGAEGDAIVHLKEVLDRIDLPPDEEVPDAQAIADGGGATEFTSWRIPNTRITIARVQEGPRRGEYLFTPETVESSPEFYEQVKELPYRTEGPAVSRGFLDWYLSRPGSPAVAAIVHRLPDWFENRVYGLSLWQWIGLVFVILTGLLVMFAAYYFGRSRGERMREKGVVRYCVTLLFPVVAMLVPLGLKYVVWEILTIRGAPLYVISFSSNVVFLVGLLVVIMGAGSRIAEIIISSPRIHPRGLDAQLIRIICKLLSLVAVIIVFLEGGKHLGIPLTTLLASAGVGGLAVALAAQDTLKSLFGSMMILLDKPYRAGDRVVVGDFDGVVEEIGLRSTKLRLLNGHMASIPNEEMARNRIENVGRRPHVRRVTNIHIPLDTPRVKLEKAIELIRAALDNHEGMVPDFPPRVFFNEFNPDSFNIRIIYWFHPPNYWDFLAFSEKLNLAVCRAFDEQGIRFSLPARLTYTTTESKPGPLELKVDAGKDPRASRDL